LRVEPGVIHVGEVIGILGPNGIGKTTFIKLLAGILSVDEGFTPTINFRVSYKPQYISFKEDLTVMEVLKNSAKDKFDSSWFKSEILLPLDLVNLLDYHLSELSGGELQRVAIASCLSMDADLYLLDEPSAYLDVEQRISMARVIKRIIKSKSVAAFVVEHDLIVQSILADSLMVFSGNPGRFGIAHSPSNLRKGMNTFLKDVDVTFRRDPQTGRPRVNKPDSWLDRHQKDIGEYYYFEAKGE